MIFLKFLNDSNFELLDIYQIYTRAKFIYRWNCVLIWLNQKVRVIQIGTFL